MSKNERERMTIMAGVKEQELTLIAAAGLMGVCYRQSKRIWRRYQEDGDAGLVHRLRGKPSARRKPAELRAQALALYAEERHAGFGPTLMAEQLLKARLVVDQDVAAVADRRAHPHGATTQANTSAMARTQAMLWRDAATGRLAP